MPKTTVVIRREFAIHSGDVPPTPPAAGERLVHHAKRGRPARPADTAENHGGATVLSDGYGSGGVARGLLDAACAMIRRTGSSGSHVDDMRGLADLLEPESSPATPAPDLAFADTIHVRDLDDDPAPPASGPVIVKDPEQGTQCMTPFAFPLPAAAEDVSLATRLRVLAARVRHGLRGSLEELKELWTHTNALVEGPTDGRALTVARRLRALWSLWEWERADVVRAGTIGLAVFALAAAIGAVALDRGDGATASAAASDAEWLVRKPHTVEQHTGRSFPVRMKAAR